MAITFDRVANSENVVSVLPTADAIGRLLSLRNVPAFRDLRPLLFASTDARIAESLTANNDYRDICYLTGVRDRDGFHAYSGGIDAASKRAFGGISLHHR